MPVKLDTDDWEAAVFFHLAGSESKRDRQILAKAKGPFAVSVEADLLELTHASVVVLRFEVATIPDDPLTGEVLFTPGETRTHFDTVQLLCRQQRLCWFFSDGDFRVLHSQQNPIGQEQRASFDDLLADAVRHDALIRASAHYDAQAALAEVVSHYEFRQGSARRATSSDGSN
ncbi:MAG: hypothetical protein R3268_13345 [Acidiferrobacterales bacterium]|nr:hypothetical protein [Acidiferrobacterales bacterium]